MMIKGSSYQEDITIVNVHAPNDGTSECMKQKLTEKKRETGTSTTSYQQSIEQLNKTSASKQISHVQTLDCHL